MAFHIYIRSNVNTKDASVTLTETEATPTSITRVGPVWNDWMVHEGVTATIREARSDITRITGRQASIARLGYDMDLTGTIQRKVTLHA